jgi:hypothetical protein
MSVPSIIYYNTQSSPLSTQVDTSYGNGTGLLSVVLYNDDTYKHNEDNVIRYVDSYVAGATYDKEGQI